MLNPQKKLRVQIWAKWAKIGPKIRVVLPFSEVLFLVLLEITYDESLEQYLTSRGKTLEKKWWRGYIIGSEIMVFAISSTLLH